MNNSNFELSKKLDRIDFEVLYNIYLLRCLTIRQVYRNFYANDIENFKDFNNNKLQKLLSLGVVEIVDFSLSNQALFLTVRGVDIIRDIFELPTNIVDSKTKTIKRGYYRASELKMLPRLINHQVHLNQFVLDFKIRANKDELKWKYFDEKFLSQYVNIRPDGLIRIMDTDFFLEMDMSSESKVQLMDKWKHYRSFLKSREYTYKERKIVVLFIVESSNIEKRKDVVKLTSSEILLDIFDSDFDIYVGSKDELLDLLFDRLILNIHQTNYKEEKLKNIFINKFGFAVANGERIKKSLHDSEYSYYIRKLNSSNSITIDGGKLQEYLLDSYDFEPLSVMKKIAYLDRNNAMFKSIYHRILDYIVVVESPERIFKDLRLLDLLESQNVYFTTFKRLEELPLFEALFIFNNLGDMYHFADCGLNKQIYEKTLKI